MCDPRQLLDELASRVPDQRTVSEDPNVRGRVSSEESPHELVIVRIRERCGAGRWPCVVHGTSDQGNKVGGQMHLPRFEHQRDRS